MKTMKTMKHALILIVGLAALATADDVRRQDTRLFSIPAQPKAPKTTPGRLSILPVSLSSASASASPAPTTIGNITGSAPPPNETILYVAMCLICAKKEKKMADSSSTVTTLTSGASQTTTSGSGSASTSSSATSVSKLGPSTGTQSQTSNPAAAPTVANYVAGLATLAGLAVAM
ncbi:hypothetical protein EsDP_00000789 [Epichloe bromicola]|uniref:Uncharacterized protein n=1 Tax=Epichloe bromicola TaxID=79588 RepID=A0ABQ0CFX2_9HYPO